MPTTNKKRKNKKREENVGKKIYELLEAVMGLPCNFRITNIAADICLEAVDKDGDYIDDTIPLFELTPAGELIGQAKSGDNREAPEILRDVLEVTTKGLTEQVNVRLTRAELKSPQQRAKTEGRTVSQLIREKVR